MLPPATNHRLNIVQDPPQSPDLTLLPVPDPDLPPDRKLKNLLLNPVLLNLNLPPPKNPPVPKQ